MKRLAVAAVTAALALLAAGCGGGEAAGDKSDALTVSAAASLRNAMEDYAGRFDAARVRLSFAGSDELAGQIRQGAKPDVFAAANTKLPEALHAEGLVEKPVVFAGNRLVIAVPADSGGIASIDDLAAPGVKLAIGSDSVPIGEYTRTVVGRLGAERSDAIMKNVRSHEPDVKGIVGKLTQGAVDAGFVYITDVEGARGALRAIELPDDLRPSVDYGVAIVKGGRNPEAAKRFVDGLLSGAGADALRQAGFEAP